jgi:hypothetical protein
LFENPIDSQNCRRLRCYLSPHQMATTGIDFTNILHPAFTHVDPKSIKMTDELTVFFALLGSACIKAACEMLMKLRPDENAARVADVCCDRLQM